MNRDTYVRLAALAFGLILLGFVILGFGRLLFPFRTAQLLSAPAILAALALVGYLLIRGVLSVVGISPIDEDDQ